MCVNCVKIFFDSNANMYKLYKKKKLDEKSLKKTCKIVGIVV